MSESPTGEVMPELSLRALTAVFEKLNGTLVLFGRLARRKRAKIPSLTGLWVLLAGIEPVFARCKFTNHRISDGFM